MNRSLAASIFIAAVCMVVMFSVSTNSRNSIMIKEFAYVVAGALAAGFMGVSFLSGGRLHLQRVPGPAASALALIAGLMAVMHFAGPVTSVNGPFTMASFAALSAMAFFGVTVLEKRHVAGLSLAVTVFSALVFIYALFQWLGLNIFPWDSGLTRTGRTSGSLGNPNLLGSFAAAMIPFGAASILSGRIRIWRAVSALLFSALAVTAIVSSGTRGSLIGVAAGLGFMAVWFFRNRGLHPRLRLFAAAAALAMVAVSVLPMRNRLSEISPGQEQIGTAQVRRVIWEGGLGMFRDRPLLGWGPGSFQIVFPEYRDPYYNVLGVSHNTLHAHCEYLEILGDIGILGLLLWGVFAFSMAKRFRNAGLLTVGAAGGAVSMLAENLVSVSLRWPPTSWLFALLCMVFLVRDGGAPKESGRAARVGLGMVFSGLALVLGWFALTAYPAMLESSRLVFRGKEFHLNSTEPAMASAAGSAQSFVSTGDPSMASATVNAWMAATVHADSAIAICTRAVERCPTDLGAYYALGSAYLTRAILASPTDRNIASALDYMGIRSHNPEEARSLNRRGMETYTTLISMAPNYAETHNNMAIGYLALGDLRSSLDELYLAWRLHGHRRRSYLFQAQRLQRIVPDSHSGALLLWGHLMEELSIMAGDGFMAKAEVHTENLAMTAWFLERASADPDSLRDSIQRVSEEAMPGSWAGIETVLLSLRTPDLIRAEALEHLDAGRHLEGLVSLAELHRIQNHTGSVVPTAWPGLGREYSRVPRAAGALGWTDQAVEAAFDNYATLFEAEHLADGAFQLSRGTYSLSVEPSVRDSLEQLLLNLGGPRAAMRMSRRLPWIEGSALAETEAILESLRLSDTTRADFPVLQTRFYYLSVASLWWEGSSFLSEYNDYLLTRLFESRDRAARLLGNHASHVLSRALETELQRVSHRLDSRSQAVLEELRRDLVMLVPR